ncbi:hypothetical protein [Prochlorococcus marinus]|uniref:hypothetical protein n=1 Tax=Prochlorococcus marinus TaxID=1219 RepID=UPI0022B5B57E|nr:hypothetical protein [Prochlorococcus marinus]
MKINKINNLLEYLSATVIISYFFIHNILLVLIGIIFSLYLININFITSFLRSLKIDLIIEKVYQVLIKKDKVKKSDSINTKSITNGPQLTLVEKIEELGFIPSIKNNNDNNAL